MLERGEGLKPSYWLRAEGWAWRFDASTGLKLRATGHHPVTITTYHAPRTNRADTQVRPYDEMNHKLRATGHMLLFRHLMTEVA